MNPIACEHQEAVNRAVREYADWNLISSSRELKSWWPDSDADILAKFESATQPFQNMEGRTEDSE